MFSSRRLRRVLPLTALAATTLIASTACGGGSDSAGDGTRVVASFYPLAWLSEQVGGAEVSVDTLTKPGAEPHDLELTPRQIAGLGEAGLVVYIKGLQPAVDKEIGRAKNDALDAASVVKTLPPPAEDGHGDEHGEEGHEDEASYDPHVWLDPSRMAAIATAVGERLAGADTAHAATYRANAKALAGRLTALDGEFRAGLKSCKLKSMVTAHAAFGYLADRYGLTQVSIAGIDPNSEPSPKRLAELTHEIKDNGATTVFTETLVSPKVAQTLAREAGVRTATLDPVEGLAEGSRDDYLSIMRKNLTTLRTALSCS
ncbi:metal ABC transporter substrate-binding protein [Thermomonospora umbrina]|uniref:Zinc transport system substrate-binding protein n=1 Tax=Thermomonospora umbrina TaxID=111806 RepID=A0A3D9T6D7_9ACTN|nr:metal ABC transporter substrate-binding protein [Thermomonospora umbrina]REE99321.1 zinc transport system substrate-binding protein [Thermomonospora umbrina]